MGLVSTIGSCLLSALAPAHEVTESVLGELPRGAAVVIAPDGRNAAVRGFRGSRAFVWWNGVAGPELDRFDGSGGQYWQPTNPLGPRPPALQMESLLLSPDGTRLAYGARVGGELVVFVDHEPVGRFPARSYLKSNYIFSPGSKHVFFTVDDTSYLDGRALPAPMKSNPLFSADESRHAYVGLDRERGQVFVVDGVVQDELPTRFLWSGAALVTEVGLRRADGRALQRIAVDGRVLVELPQVSGLWAAPSGGRVAVAYRRPASEGGGGMRVNVDGEDVYETDPSAAVRDVIFSPDGKRWAALCAGSGQAACVVVDGRKERDYGGVSAFTFSPDSTRHAYVGLAQPAGLFVLADGEERTRAFSAYPDLRFRGANRLTYWGLDKNDRNGVVVTVDDAETLVRLQNTNVAVTFSDDGSRWSVPAGSQSVIDGAASDLGPPVFSPDGAHAAQFGGTRETGFAVHVDGVRLPDPKAPPIWMAFSRDGAHFAVLSLDHGTQTLELFVDGERALSLADVENTATTGQARTYVREDGSFGVIVVRRGVLTRYDVVPGESSVATMLARAGE